MAENRQKATAGDRKESRLDEHPRITGQNPPLHLWDRFPNWQNAYEEETLDDQDETTLRPADNQQAIDDDVSFAAGEAVLAGGQKLPALLALVTGEIDYVYAYPNPSRDECWVLRSDLEGENWVAMNEDWFLEIQGILPVPLQTPGLFPMRVISRLPLASTGRVIDIEIRGLNAK